MGDLIIGAMQTTLHGRGSGVASINGGSGDEQRGRRECIRAMF